MDKQLLKETLARYQTWNADKFVSQVAQSAKMTPKERWLAYQDMYAFGMTIRPKTSVAEQLYTMREWKEYLARIRRFELWRQRRGKAA